MYFAHGAPASPNVVRGLTGVPCVLLADWSQRAIGNVGCSRSSERPVTDGLRMDAQARFDISSA